MLRLSHVSKSFPMMYEPVLNDVSLAIKKGEFCVIVGANGSGKSTMLKTISGELEQDSGEIIRHGAVAEVVQDVNRGTVSALSLFENLALSQIRRDRPKFAFYRRFKARTKELIKILDIGLESAMDKPLSSLSGGQKQAIATLMALRSGCQILLLDEHTSALDPKMQVAIMEFTAKAARELRLTTLMVTHKMDDAVKYGDRLIIMSGGRIVKDISGSDKARLKPLDLLEMFRKQENREADA